MAPPSRPLQQTSGTFPGFKLLEMPICRDAAASKDSPNPITGFPIWGHFAVRRGGKAMQERGKGMIERSKRLRNRVMGRNQQ